MGEVRGDLDFAEEAFRPNRGGGFGPPDLHRDFAAVFEIFRQVDRGHTARAEFALDAVAILESGGHAINRHHTLPNKTPRAERARSDNLPVPTGKLAINRVAVAAGHRGR
jgi:hypothetical protein